MKSVSLKNIIDSLMKEESNLDNCKSLQKLIEDNFIWKNDGNIKLKTRDWNHINNDI